AAGLLERSGQHEALAEATRREDTAQATSAIAALGYLDDDRVRELLQSIVTDTDRNRQVRTAAAEALGRSGRGQRFLLSMAQRGQVDEGIAFAVTNALLGSNQEPIRREAAEYLQPPAAAEDAPLPPIRE